MSPLLSVKNKLVGLSAATTFAEHARRLYRRHRMCWGRGGNVEIGLKWDQLSAE